MSNVTTWFDNAAGNNVLTPPDGMPENATKHSDVNNVSRENQAAERRQWNELGWFEYGDGSGPYAATFLTASSFRIAGSDVTAVYTPNTRIRIFQNSFATELIGVITSSAENTGDTDVFVALEAGSISNSTIDQVSLGLLGSPNPAPVATSIGDADRDTRITTEDTPDEDAIVERAGGVLIGRGTSQARQWPAQPGFSYFIQTLQSDVTGAGARYLIPFPGKNFERGGMMSASFDTMTAVVDGIYAVDYTLTLQNINEEAISLNMDIERSDGVIWRWSLAPPNLPGNATDYAIHQSRKIEMVAGQTLQFFIGISGLAGNTIDLIGSTDRNRCEVGVMLMA